MKRAAKQSHHVPHHHKLVLLGMTGFFAMFFFLLPRPSAQAIDIGVSATVPGAPPSGGGAPPPPPPPPDITPPIISNIRVPVLWTDSAEVAWDTNETANSFVDFGETLAYELGTVSDTPYVFSRQLALTGLTINTLYHFRVRSADSSGNMATSADQTFTTLATPDGTPPVISNVNVINITGTSATVTWDTDESADSEVQYGLSLITEHTAASATPVVSHSVSLNGLTPNTDYVYAVFSKDSAGNQASEGAFLFTTLDVPDTVPPANVANLTVQNVPSQPALQLTWTNPTDSDFAGVYVLVRTDHSPVDMGDGRLLYDGLATSVMDTNLDPGTTYYYSLFAYDVNGNVSSGAFGQGTIPVGVPFALRVRPEKRVTRVGGNYDVSGLLDVRAPGTVNALESISADIPKAGEVALLSLRGVGLYDMSFKGLGYLRQTEPNINLSIDTTIDLSRGGTRMLLGGDTHVSNDNLVNALDISTLLGKLSTGFLIADLNRDGLVNALDLSTQLTNISKRGDN